MQSGQIGRSQRQAPVGFQCPDCVKEGVRSTRQARTAYGGRITSDASLVSRILVGINVAVFLLVMVTGGRRSELVDRLALLPETIAFRAGQDVVTLRGVADSVYGAGGAYWQPLTSMFTHVQLLHIGFNMLALWVLGPQLEAALGRARFLALYLLSGLTGSVAVLYLSHPFSQTLGASGSIFGLLAGLLLVVWKVRGDVRAILAWIAVNFVITLLGSSVISWQGHVGGFVGGLGLAALLVYAPRQRRAVVQWTGIALFSALLLALLLVRVTALG